MRWALSARHYRLPQECAHRYGALVEFLEYRLADDLVRDKHHDVVELGTVVPSLPDVVGDELGLVPNTGERSDLDVARPLSDEGLKWRSVGTRDAPDNAIRHVHYVGRAAPTQAEGVHLYGRVARPHPNSVSIGMLEPIDRLVFISDDAGVSIAGENVNYALFCLVQILVLVNEHVFVSTLIHKLRMRLEVPIKERNHFTDEHPLVELEPLHQAALEFQITQFRTVTPFLVPGDRRWQPRTRAIKSFAAF